MMTNSPDAGAVRSAGIFGELDTKFREELEQLNNLVDRAETIANRFHGAIPNQPTTISDKPSAAPDSVVEELAAKLDRMDVYLDRLRSAITRLEEL